MPPLLFSISGQSIMLHAQDEIESRLQILFPGCRVSKHPVGGSSMASWQHGHPSGYYNALLNDILLAVQEGYIYAASIFQNGQTDAKYPDAAKEWKKLFWAFCRDLRLDAGRPGVPVIYGQLGQKPVTPDGYLPTYTEWELIQGLQLDALYKHDQFEMVDLMDAGPYDEKNKPYCHYLPGNRVAELMVDGVVKKVKPKADALLKYTQIYKPKGTV